MGDDIEMASPTDIASCREVLTEYSADELLARLVRGSPMAHVTLAGVPVLCVLDTGAETSLINASFYRKHLSPKISGLNKANRYLPACIWSRSSRIAH